MKRFFTVLTIFSLVFGSVATAGPKRKPQRTTRTIEGSYAAPAIFVYGSCSDSGGVGCVSFTTGPNERFVTARAVDAHGLPVFVLIRDEHMSDPIEGAEVYGTFCGETPEPIAVPPGRNLQFWVGAPFAVYACQPGAGTTGTITATFSNLP